MQAESSKAGSALASKEAQLTKVSKELLAAQDKLSKAADGGKTCQSSLKRVSAARWLSRCLLRGACMLSPVGAELRLHLPSRRALATPGGVAAL